MSILALMEPRIVRLTDSRALETFNIMNVYLLFSTYFGT